MINHDNKAKTLNIKNNTVNLVVDYNSGVMIKELSNVKGGENKNTDLDSFYLSIHGKDYTSTDFKLLDVTCAEDKILEIATFLLELKEEQIKVKLHFMNDKKDTVSILYQISDDYKLGVPTVCKIHLPLLANINIADKSTKYYPSSAVKTPSGENVLLPVRELFYVSDIVLPYIIADDNEKYGFSVHFPVLSDLNDAGASQNVNIQFRAMQCEDDVKNHKIQVNPDNTFNDAVEMRIVGLERGWAEAFDRYRDIWASTYDFSEYDRKDLKWFDECVVHNFVYLYGSEGVDLDTLQINTEKLLKQGEEFGGYDTVTIWNQYPRLGIDKRTQWDFYDDFPGGRPAIRKAVDEMHAKGVYVFLPYIPWDRGPFETTNSIGDEFVRTVTDTNADGYQLDTMKDLPYSYRAKLDSVKPGIVLTTQSHPLKKHPMEFITTSWDEFWYTNPMPEVDVLRFIHPAHLAPLISRWLRLEDKDVLLSRMEFNATPIVIWQDIFGRQMPFSDAQKARIKTYKAAYLEYRLVYQGLKPTPLYPTKVENLYCNYFVGDNGEGEIYSLYNDTDTVLSAKIPLVTNSKNAKVVLGKGEASLIEGKIDVKVEPKSVLHVFVK